MSPILVTQCVVLFMIFCVFFIITPTLEKLTLCLGQHYLRTPRTIRICSLLFSTLFREQKINTKGRESCLEFTKFVFSELFTHTFPDNLRWKTIPKYSFVCDSECEFSWSSFQFWSKETETFAQGNVYNRNRIATEDHWWYLRSGWSSSFYGLS